MQSSQPAGAPASKQPPTPSASSQSSKRKEPEAGLPGRESPPKKRHIDPPTSDTFLNLSTIILVGQVPVLVDGVPSMTYKRAALDEFSDENNHGTHLRPKHFNYESFRDWAETSLGIPRDRPVHFNVEDASDEITRLTVNTKFDFTVVLTQIWTGTFKPTHTINKGAVLGVCGAQATAPPVVQPQAQVKQPDKPEPEKKPDEDLPREPTPKLPSPIILSDDEEDNQQPLPADQFLDLVRKAKTPDDVILKRAVKDEPNAGSRLWKIDPRWLVKALIFFNTYLDGNDECPVQGLKDTLKLWQLVELFRMFMNPITTGINGGIIGLDVGFGKTRLILVYLLARARFCQLKKEVDAEWETGKPIHHLSKNNKDKTARCPSQKNHMIQCPCSWDSELQPISNYMGDLPALIITPPSLKDTWRTEMKATFTDYDTPEQFLQFFYYYGDPTPGNDMRNVRGRQQIVDDTSGVLNDEELLDIGKGNSRHIFLVGNKMCEKLLTLYIPEGTKHPLAAFGVIIMDEMQNFKGSEGSETIAHRVANYIQSKSFNPVALFALCGTSVEESYTLWRAPANHYANQWELFGKTGVLRVKSGEVPDVLLENSMDNITRLHKQLTRAHAEGTAVETETKAKTDTIRAYLTPFVSAIRQGQVWRGQVLNPLPPVNDRNIEIAPVTDVKTRQVRDSLTLRVEAIIKRELDKRKNEWNQRKNQAQEDGTDFAEDQPTRHDIIQGALLSQTNTNAAWLTLARSVSYPYIAVLKRASERRQVEDEPISIPSDMFKSEHCQKIPVKVQSLIEKDPNKQHAKLDDFQGWDFAPYADMLKEQCSKLKGLRTLIDEMVADTDPLTEPPKRDPCRKRHAIAFHTQPLSAVLTYFFLITDKELCEKVEPILFTASIPLPRRQEIMNEMRQPGKATDRNKVLIAVTDIAAEGFNLQRMNNVWFIEVPTTLTKYLQAIGRAVRSGQEMKVNIVRMYDKENLLEDNTFKMLMGKHAVSQRIYNVEVK